jgi:hypothetical protein
LLSINSQDGGETFVGLVDFDVDFEVHSVLRWDVTAHLVALFLRLVFREALALGILNPGSEGLIKLGWLEFRHLG